VDYHIPKIGGLDTISPREMAAAAGAQGFPAQFYGRANSITIPIGFDPGVAYLLVPRTTMDGLDPDAEHTITWLMSRDGALVTTAFLNWTICDARLQGIDGDEKAAYLLTLRDRRQKLKQAAVINTAYNVSVPAPCGIEVDNRRWIEATLNAGALWTWQEMLDDVWALLGIAGTCPVLTWTPPHEPDTWRFHGIQAWDAVRMICDACQCTVAPLADGSGYEFIGFEALQSTTYLTVLASRILLDEKPKDPCGCELPAALKIVFPTRRGDACDSDALETWEAEPVYSPAAIPTGLACAASGTVRPVRSDLIGELNCGGAVENLAAIIESATLIAARAILRMGIAKDLCRWHAGICPEVLLGNSVHEIRYRDYGDEWGCLTESRGYLRWGLPADTWNRPARDCDCGPLMVKALECIKPGDVDKSVQPMMWDQSSKCWVVDPDRDPVYISDCRRWLLAIPDECFEVKMTACCDDYSCYQPTMPYGLTRRVKITEEIGCGSCGEVLIMKGTDGCMTSESECTISACNTSNRKLGCDADEYATLHCPPGECGTSASCYGFLVANARALRAFALAQGALCGGTEASVGGFTPLDVCDWTTRTPVTIVGNPGALHACADARLELGWNDSDCKWEITGVPDVELPKYIKDARCKSGACEIEKMTYLYPYYGHFCNCEDQTEVWDTLLEGERVTLPVAIEAGEAGEGGVSVFTGVSCSAPEDEGCGLKFTTSGLTSAALKVKQKTFCMFCADPLDTDDAAGPAVLSSGGAAGESVLAGEWFTFVTDVEPGESGSGASVLTNAQCGEGCEIVFSRESIAAVPSTIKRTKVCLICAKSEEAEDLTGPAGIVFAAGTSVTLAGTYIDVITDFAVLTAETSSGGGDSVECEDEITGSVYIKGTTKRICVFCSLAGGGSIGSGTDITFPLELKKIEAATYIDFDCDPCPSLAWDKTAFWAFCVGTEASGGSSSCTCVDCEEEASA
jgi:hypothetical protein